MKKIIGALVALSVGFAAFADGITNNLGVGFSIPVGTVKIEDADDDMQFVNFAVNGSYLGILDNGVTFKGDLFVGLATSKDVNIVDDDSNSNGFYFAFDLGAGYSFINNETITLAVIGIFGLDVNYFAFDDKAEGMPGVKTDYEYNITAVDVNLGGDITALFHVKENFGVYANLGFRGILGGNASVKDFKVGGVSSDNYNSDNDIKGKFLFVPTVGVMWTL